MNDRRRAGALAPADRWLAGRRAFAVGAAALVVASSAQVTVPVPLSPVPMTLQPLAVLAVGGLLGATLGGSALLLYLGLGLLGLQASEKVSPPGAFNLVSKAEARVGRPLTPVSAAGVARRTVRRCAAGVYNC